MGRARWGLVLVVGVVHHGVDVVGVAARQGARVSLAGHVTLVLVETHGLPRGGSHGGKSRRSTRAAWKVQRLLRHIKLAITQIAKRMATSTHRGLHLGWAD